MTSAGTNDGDCWGCDEADLYPQMWSFHQSAASGHWQQTSEADGAECSNEDRVIYTSDACMSSWFRYMIQEVSSSGKVTRSALAGEFQLWENDGGGQCGTTDSNCDDEITTISPGRHPRIEIDFFASTMGITSALGQRPGNAPTPYPLSDNEPISYCGNYTYDTMCIRAKWTELVK